MTEPTTDHLSQADMLSWIEMISTPREQLSPATICLRHMRSILRATLDLSFPPQDPQASAFTTRPENQYIDPVAWLLWAEMGLCLFAFTREEPAEPSAHVPGVHATQASTQTPDFPDIPSIRRMMLAAQRVAVMLAMVRHKNNLTQAAATLGLSRRSLRDLLRRIRVYPWSDFVAGNLARSLITQTDSPGDEDSVPDDNG